MMIFSIAFHAILLGVIILACKRESPFEHMGPLLVTAAAPPIVGIFPVLWISGWVGEVLGLALTLYVLHILLKFFFELDSRGALAIMGIYFGVRILIGILLRLLMSA